MTGRRRLAAGLLAAGMLTALTGCPAPVDRPPEATTTTPPPGDALPGRPTDASIDLPAYPGPPAGVPPSLGPLRTVLAAVDLTPATPGVFARTAEAVAAPGGGAYVLLTPQNRALPQSLVTVDTSGVRRAVPVPRMDGVWGMHVLGDGTIAMTGPMTADGRRGYGFEVADPTTGAVRAQVTVPADVGTVSAEGGSAVGGGTLYLLVSTGLGGGVRDRLLAVDVASGAVLADRDLAADVAEASSQPIGSQLGGLVPRPEGGVTLAFDASPTDAKTERIPTLLAYDAALQPVGDPVRATDLSEGAEIQAVAGAADGTVFLLLEVDDGTWVLAIPDGGGAGPLLGQLEERIYNYALVVEPAQQWAVLPSPDGVLSIDLTTGETSGPLEFDCGPRLDVQGLRLGLDGTGAVAIGECDEPREDTQMVWLLGP